MCSIHVTVASETSSCTEATGERTAFTITTRVGGSSRCRRAGRALSPRIRLVALGAGRSAFRFADLLDLAALTTTGSIPTVTATKVVREARSQPDRLHLRRPHPRALSSRTRRRRPSAPSVEAPQRSPLNARPHHCSGVNGPRWRRLPDGYVLLHVRSPRPTGARPRVRLQAATPAALAARPEIVTNENASSR
jgi:hypothetical protein